MLEAGEEARKKLIEHGVVTDENAVERLMKERPKLMLPGMPSYIPHQWTIKTSQRMMYDLLKMWQFEHGKDRVENLALFIEYAISEMNNQEEVARMKMQTMEVSLNQMKDIPVLGKVFEPITQHETIKAMSKFFVDAFAVCVVVRGEAAKTSDFATWFLQWTDDLCTIWERNKPVIPKLPNEKKKKRKKSIRRI